MLTIEELREQYPNPTPAHTGGYGVGGALLMALDTSVYADYPSPERLAHDLGEWRVPPEHAAFVADHLIMANDAGDFEAAWKCADLALQLIAEHSVDSTEGDRE